MLSIAYNRKRGSSHSYICDSFYFNATHFAFSHGTCNAVPGLSKTADESPKDY